MLEEILSYLDRGFSIIPIPPREKAPIIKWKEFQSRKFARGRKVNPRILERKSYGCARPFYPNNSINLSTR